jgi:hypothetical protein
MTITPQFVGIFRGLVGFVESVRQDTARPEGSISRQNAEDLRTHTIELVGRNDIGWREDCSNCV